MLTLGAGYDVDRLGRALSSPGDAGREFASIATPTRNRAPRNPASGAELVTMACSIRLFYALAGILLGVAGSTLGWLWFRDSLVLAAVERVTITGRRSSCWSRRRCARRFETAYMEMSTLRVDEQALEQVVEPFSSVAGLRVRPDFPHDLGIEVIEHELTATLKTGGSSVPTTGGGLLLDGVRAADLPIVTTKARRAAATSPTSGRSRRSHVAAAAPPELRERSERLFYGPSA